MFSNDRSPLPLRSGCNKIRDDQGSWSELEVYIDTHSEAEFTHAICQDCARRLYPEVDLDRMLDSD